MIGAQKELDLLNLAGTIGSVSETACEDHAIGGSVAVTLKCKS
jgi:hypothetical protein